MINFTTELLDYQKTGVEKLSKLTVGALFMEQGTGKTRTALELIDKRLDADKVDRVLWLCPCSVKSNLKADIIKHCGAWPDFITVIGIESISASLKAYGEALKTVGTDKKCYLIVDESLLVKNPKAVRTDRITNLSTKCKYKLILNGTPFSKCEADLFTQFYILDPRILGYNSFYSFAANHLEYDDKGKICNVLDKKSLSRKITPYSFQVLKKDVLNLKDKNYKTIYYKPTSEQIEHYYDVANQFFELMECYINDADWETTIIYRMFNALQKVLSGQRIKSIKMYTSESEPIFKDPKDNPRIQALIEKYVTPLMSNNEKGIIFCKFTDEIDNITTIINEMYGEGTAVIYDGKRNIKQRDEAMEHFKTDAHFLVTTKSCSAFGLNLQFCSNICFYNNDWDYATRAQAEDRIHRMGQDKECYIYDVTSYDYLDDKILQCIYKKENAIDNFKNQVSLDSLRDFVGIKKEQENNSNMNKK